MTLLGDDSQKAKIAASLLLTTPGVPFIYYGEEIGMLGKKPDLSRSAPPMQWSAEANSGFTSGTPWEALNDDYAKKNAAAQLKDPASLLAHYRALIRLRNADAALRTGECLPIESRAPTMLAFLRPQFSAR